MMASAPHTPAQGVPVPAIGFAPMPAVARVLAGFQRDQLANFIEVAIGLLDIADPDPDLEDATDLEDDHALSPHAIGYNRGPGCEVADTGENAWVEWDKMRGSQKSGHNLTAGAEDDEESDTDSCLAGDDRGTATFADDRDGLPGCPMDAEESWDREEDYSDNEREQMLDDVPMPPVVTLEHNLFNDQRQPLGIGNLMNSFRVGGEGVRSADSGAVHRSNGESWPRTPGVPV